MNFDRLTNISKELTVGEINNPYEFTIEIAINTAGLISQTISSRLDYNSIFNDQKQLRNKTLQDCCGNSAFKQ